MSEPKTLVVVGLISPDENAEPDLPDNLPEFSAYELGIRFRVGRTIPDQILILLSSQEEMTELLSAIEGVNLKLILMTDDPNQPKPDTLDALWDLLPKGESVSLDPPPEEDNPFRIL